MPALGSGNPRNRGRGGRRTGRGGLAPRTPRPRSPRRGRPASSGGSGGNRGPAWLRGVYTFMRRNLGVSNPKLVVTFITIWLLMLIGTFVVPVFVDDPFNMAYFVRVVLFLAALFVPGTQLLAKGNKLAVKAVWFVVITMAGVAWYLNTPLFDNGPSAPSSSASQSTHKDGKPGNASDNRSKEIEGKQLVLTNGCDPDGLAGSYEFSSVRFDEHGLTKKSVDNAVYVVYVPNGTKTDLQFWTDVEDSTGGSNKDQRGSLEDMNPKQLVVSDNMEPTAGFEFTDKDGKTKYYSCLHKGFLTPEMLPEQ